MVTQFSNNNWDLLVDNRYGQPTLIVEVKSRIGTSSSWAAKLRRNLLAHGILPFTPYFLIAFPDKFYLWKHDSEDNWLHEVEPDYTIDASSILQPYFQEIGVKDNQIRGSSLEMIIVSWLNRIMYDEKTIEESKISQSWLVNSGLYSALTGGKIIHRVEA